VLSALSVVLNWVGGMRPRYVGEMPQSMRRLGRPPAVSSAETRERILDVARRVFAELGFEATTNRVLAERAGITTGALYHYFDSKQSIYQAVYDDVQTLVYEHFEKAIIGIDPYAERFAAILETAHSLNNEDPSLARFVGTARVDLARHHELRERLVGPVGTGQQFFDRLLDEAVDRGEIPSSRKELVRSFQKTVIAGLTDAVSKDRREHRRAVDAIVAALNGNLLSAVPADRP
jgi:AcrR family transcriptional regulator